MPWTFRAVPVEQPAWVGDVLSKCAHRFRTRLVGVLAEGDGIGASLRRCWLDVSNSRGAVGFPFVPVSDEAMNEAMRRLIDDVDSGSVLLFVAENEDGLVGWVSLRLNQSALTRHWATVERLQSRPEHRNDGVAKNLMSAVVDHAATIGLEQLRLVVRGGEGLESFYSRLGWTEIGRHRAALRMAEGDDRDEVSMMLPISPDPFRAQS